MKINRRAGLILLILIGSPALFYLAENALEKLEEDPGASRESIVNQDRVDFFNRMREIIRENKRNSDLGSQQINRDGMREVFYTGLRDGIMDYVVWTLENNTREELIDLCHGKSPFNLIAESFKFDSTNVERLKNHRPDPLLLNMMTDEGKTALEMANDRGQSAFVEYLVANGSDPDFRDIVENRYIDRPLLARRFKEDQVLVVFPLSSKAIQDFRLPVAFLDRDLEINKKETAALNRESEERYPDRNFSTIKIGKKNDLELSITIFSDSGYIRVDCSKSSCALL